MREANLARDAWCVVLLAGVRAGTLGPSRVEDDEVREYSADNLAVLLLAAPKWE